MTPEDRCSRQGSIVFSLSPDSSISKCLLSPKFFGRILTPDGGDQGGAVCVAGRHQVSSHNLAHHHKTNICTEEFYNTGFHFVTVTLTNLDTLQHLALAEVSVLTQGEAGQLSCFRLYCNWFLVCVQFDIILLM